MVPRLSSEELAAALGRRLGGRVRDLRRLSGGASRVTSAFELDSDEVTRPLIVQLDRGGAAPSGRVRMEGALLRAAAGAGVPVPGVVALGERDELGTSWLVVERLDGETIPRKILRDDQWVAARRALTGQAGRALAAIHTIDPATIEGLAPADPLGDPLPFLDALGEVRPALELGVRWLAAHRPPSGPGVAVHGDYRLGNFLVGPDGLRGVLDWELAHTGDPAEDIGWLCAPAWRFGGSGEVGGFGDLSDLLAAYSAAGGEVMTPDRVHWWQVYATVKWATICAPERGLALRGVGHHRPPRLRERVGPLRPSGHVAERHHRTPLGGRTDGALRAPHRGRVGRGGGRVPQRHDGTQRGRRTLRGARGAQRPGDRRA
jgi:aminoglycoside phosphotransferase (APT) family kinase protein